MEVRYCQSCGMPLGEDNGDYGTEADGSKSRDYCRYCYENGAFTADCTMEEMIDFCVTPMVSANADMTEEKARAMMGKFFPLLKRWKKS